MKSRKAISILSVLLALGMSTALFSGCHSAASSSSPSGTSSSTSGSSSAPLSAVTLKVVLPGDRPADMDKVLAEAKTRMADTLNVSLDVTFVDWNDLSSKTQVMLSSGQDEDLMFDAPWLHLASMVTQGYYAPLDDLLKQYGSSILSKRPQQMWDANKFGTDGKTYAIPLNSTVATNSRVYVYRKDLLQKVGMTSINSYDDLIKFAYAVKAKFPNIIPYTPGNGGDETDADVRAMWDYKTHITPSTDIDDCLALYFKNNDGKVYNLFDQMDPTIWSWITNARKLYQDGIINQDILSVKSTDSLMASGKTAIIVRNDWGVDSGMEQQLEKAVPGASMDYVAFYDFTPKANISDFKDSNFMCIPKTSKNAARAIQFLNWANSSQDNYDLLAYGIKGTDWQDAGTGLYKPIGTGYSWFPYAWIWNPVQERMNSTSDDRVIKMHNFLKNPDNFTASKLTGFTFDPTNVSNEIASFNTIYGKYYNAIFDGVVDPTTTWAKFKAEAAGPVAKIQTEMQSQIDKYLASK